jgi:soluble lytic murein transglycosylase-like protein
VYAALKSLKIENLLKVPTILIAVMVIIVIVVIIARFGSNTPSIDTKSMDTKSANPDAVIPPVETQPEKKNDDYLKGISLSNAINIEKAFYGWQNLFDIFSYNSNDSAFIVNDSLARQRNLTMILSNPNRRFSKGNSDKILEDYGSVIIEECAYYKLDWRLVLAMIKQESAFTPDAVSALCRSCRERAQCCSSSLI